MTGQASTTVTFPLEILAEPQNQKPVISSYTYSATAAQGSPYQAQFNAFDPDGDSFDFEVEVRDSNGVLVDPQGGAVISINQAGILSWQAPQTAGQYTVTVTAKDSRQLASVPLTLQLNVVSNATNSNPVIDSFSYPAAATAGSPYQVPIPAHDPDGDPIIYSVQSVTPAPTTMPAFAAGTGLLQWNEPGAIGTYTIVVKVADGRGGEALAQLEVDVQTAPANDPPVFNTLSLPGPATQGMPYQTAIQVSDPNGDPIVSYALDAVSAAKGMAIDNQGLLTWTPAAQQVGGHSLIVTVTDQRGASANKTYPLFAQAAPQNRTPQIVTTSLGRATIGAEFISGVEAWDPDGDSFTFEITDISPTPTTAPSINAATGALTWAAPELPSGGSQFTLTVVATDSRGLASQAHEVTLSVVTTSEPNLPPVIDSFSYYNVAVRQSPYQFSVPAHDPDGDPFKYSVQVHDSLGNLVDPNLSNSLIQIDETSGHFTWTAPQTAGDFTITVTVTDTRNASTSTSPALALKVVNPPANNLPMITTSDIDLASPGINSLFQATIVAEDQDGDRLTWSSAVLTAPDASPVPANRYSMDAGSGLFTFSTPEIAGEYTLVVTVSDGRGPAVLKTLHLNVVDKPNTAPAFDTLTLPNPAANVGYQTVIDAHDADGNPIYFSLDAASIAKGISIDNTGWLTWQPKTEQQGPHEIVVLVTDNMASATKTYSVTVGLGVNAPPKINSTALKQIVAGQEYLYLVTASDPNNDPIKYSLESPPDGMTIDPSTGLIRWTTSAAHIGPPHAVRVKAYEDVAGGAFDLQSYEITVVSNSANAPPKIESDPRRATTLDRLYGYDPVAIDPDSGVLVWSLSEAPQNMAIDPQTGRIRWQPGEHQLGDDNKVTVRVADLQGGSDTQSFLIDVRVLNAGPVISSSAVVTATVGQLYLYAVQAVDPEGDAISYVVTATNSSGTTFSVPTYNPATPTLLSIDEMGVIRWTPNEGHSGDWTIDVVAKDIFGMGTLQHYPLTVSPPQAPVDAPPLFTSTPVFIAAVNANDDGVPGQFIYSYLARATDPDNDDSGIRYSLSQVPAFNDASPTLVDPGEMTIDAITGQIIWKPVLAQLNGGLTAAHWVTLVATSNGKSTEHRFRIDLRLNNHAPEIIPDSPTQVVVGQIYKPDVHVNDADGDPLSFRLNSGPSGLVMNNVGQINWTPTAADLTTSGPGHYVEVTVADPYGAVDTRSFYVTVVADTEAPKVDLLVAPGVQVNLDEEMTFLVSAIDNVKVTAITLTLVGATFTEQLTVSANGVAHYKPIRNEPFRAIARASDAAGNSAQADEWVFVINPEDLGAPEVSLASPLGGAIITAPINVSGSISDPDNQLTSWTLSYAELNSDDFKVIHHQASTLPAVLPSVGDPNNPAVLAQFDPTILRNGSYVLRLSAFDLSGNLSIEERFVTVAGNLKLGNFRQSFTDLVIPVAGIPITITRTYDSLEADVHGELGFGWSLDVRDGRLEVDEKTLGARDGSIYRGFIDGTHVTVTLPDGSIEGFTFKAKPGTEALGKVFDYRPSFIPDAENTTRLFVSQVPLVPYGNEWTDGSGALYNPAHPAFGGEYTLISLIDGMERTIDATSGDVTAIQDANGNRISFEEDGIASNRGRAVLFERDYLGRITKITDPRGNSIVYTYNADGELASVTDRTGQATTKFTYLDSPNHYLDKIINAYDRVAFDVDYGADGRIDTITDAAGSQANASFDLAALSMTLVDSLDYTSVQKRDSKGNIIEDIDPAGNRTLFTYDSEGLQTSERFVIGQVDDATNGETNDIVTAYTYDNRGLLSLITNAQGWITGASHDMSGQITSVTDPLGSSVQFSYDDRGTFPDGTPRLGNLTAQTDAVGRTAEFGRTDFGNIDRFAKGDEESLFGFNGFGDIESIRDGNDPLRSFAYDANGNLNKFSYSWVNPDEPLDVREVAVITVFDADDRILSTTSSSGVESHEYDLLGREVAMTTPSGRVEWILDATGNQIKTSYPDGTVSHAVFDALGRVVWQTLPHRPDRIAYGTRYTYDALDQVTAESHHANVLVQLTTLPSGAMTSTISSFEATPLWTTATVYNSTGTVAQHTDAAGLTTTYEYDKLERQTAVTQIVGAVTIRTETVYDARDNRVLVRDPLGRETRFEYNELGQLTKTIYPDGTFETQSYNVRGAVVSAIDTLGRETNYSYDDDGNLLTVELPAVIDPVQQTTRRPAFTYAYDGDNNRILIRDPYGREQRFKYDEHGRQIAWTIPDVAGTPTGTELRTYDQDGRLTTVTDFKGQVAAYTYDALGRLDLERYFATVANYNAGIVANHVDYVYDVYDALGRHEQVIEPRGTTDMLYDDRGRLTRVTSPEGTINYDYDSATSRLVGMSTDQSDIDYGYDLRGLMTSVISTKQFGTVLSTPETTTYYYDAAGNMVLVTLPNGVQSQYGYDVLNRPKWIEHRAPGGALLDAYYYERDAAGKITTVFNDLAVAQVQQALAAAQGDTLDRTRYAYDALDRVLSEEYFAASAGTPFLNISHQWDLAGNKLKKTETPQTGPIEESRYTYDARNRLVDEVFSVGGVDVETTLYSHDANGALTRKEKLGDVTNYEYDFRHRLVRAVNTLTEGGQTTTTQSDYSYDHRGIRVGQTVTETVGSTSTTESEIYLIDYLSPYGHPRVIEERTSGGVLLASFVHGPQLISQTRAEGTSFYLLDRHSGVRHLTNAEGLISDTYLYDAFGNQISSIGSTPNDLLYRGEQFDSELGQYYLRARYYNPASGRFTSMDPWDGDVYRPGTLNKFLYADGDPIQRMDPTGLFSGGEVMATLGISAKLASMHLIASLQSKKKVDAGWLGKLFIDFMALNEYFTFEEEPILRPQLIVAGPYLGKLGLLAAKNIPKRMRSLNSSKMVAQLSKLVAGTYINKAKAELLGIDIKGNGFPNFSDFAYPRRTRLSLSLDIDRLVVRNPRVNPTGITFIKLTGSRAQDFFRSNLKVHLGIKPGGYTWHHHEVVGVMVLTSSLTHPHAGGLRHIGGVFFYEIAMGQKYSD